MKVQEQVEEISVRIELGDLTQSQGEEKKQEFENQLNETLEVIDGVKAIFESIPE